MHDVLNWLWQGSVVALAARFGLRFLDRAHARDRYAAGWAALLMVLLLPILPGFRPGSPSGAAGVPAAVTPLLWMPPAWWTSTAVVIALWAVWSTVQGARLAAALLALRRATASCRPFPAALEPQLRCWAEVKARGRRTRLVVSEHVRSAAVLGCCPPAIAVAPALIRHLTIDDLDRIVIHEWVHVQRRDDILNLAHLGVRAIAGWHPAVRWLERQLQIEREVACDETAVSITGCRKRYAASLTTTAGLGREVEAAPLPGALSSPRLSQRIVRVLSRKPPASAAWSAGTAASAAMALCALAIAIADVQMVAAAELASLDRKVPALSLQPGTQTVAPGISRPSDLQAGSSREAGRSSRQSSNRSRPSQRPPVDAPPETPIIPREPGHVDSTQQLLDAFGPATLHETAIERLPSVDTAPLTLNIVARSDPASTQPATVRTPWSAAAETGIGIGRGSERAGLATAGFFSRFSKKIADAF